MGRRTDYVCLRLLWISGQILGRSRHHDLKTSCIIVLGVIGLYAALMIGWIILAESLGLNSKSLQR
jgi:hypothetical protein